MRPSIAAAAPPSRRSLALIALAAALLAVIVYWPVRNGGLLADDLLLVSYILEPGPDGLQRDWSRGAADFAGPWAFVKGSYYRPLVTLSLLVDHWLAGGAEAAGHWTAITMAAASAFGVAWLCGVLFGPVAAAAGGLLFAAHPALHEPVCWPCTRADLLVVALMAWACSAWVRHLRGEPGRHVLAAHVAFVLALLAKEVGLWTLPWLVLLDLGVRGRRVALGVRVRAYAPFAAVAAAYWALRWWALGNPLAEAAASPLAAPATWLARGWSKVVASAAPHGDWLPATTPWTLGLALAAAVVVASARRDTRRWVAIGIVWWLVSLLPAQWHEVSPNLEKSRYVIAGLTGLCVVVAAACAPAERRWPRVVVMVLVLVASVDLVRGARSLQRHYDAAWTDMVRLRGQLDDAGSRASLDAPLVLLAAAPMHRGVVFLEATGAFALAQPPLARAEHPFVSLGLSLYPGVGPGLLEGELAPWRQLWRSGATLCYWFDADGTTRLHEVPSVAQLPAPRFVAAGPGMFRTDTPASPLPIGGLEVVAATPFTRGDLVWHTRGGPAGAATLGAGVARDGAFAAIADLHDDAALLAFGTLHGITGVDVVLYGDGAGAPSAVRVVPPDEPVPLRAPLRGARVAIGALGDRLPWRELPADAEPGTASAVLLTKVCACRVPRPDATGRVELPARAHQELVELERFSRRDHVWYYLECRAGGRRWRSSVDWFERAPLQ